MPRKSHAAALVALLCFALASSASAYRLPKDLGPIPGNPANKLTEIAIDDPAYDHATRCDPKVRKGVRAAAAWFERRAEGEYWGTYRCEKWGKGEASLHAESRAIDWHPASRAAAAELIELLLAPDKAGNAQALARRMGIQEIIWDCAYWSAGSEQFSAYDYCFARNGKRRKHLNPTAAHLDHIHFGFSKAGAAGRTSFWRLVLAG
jgi:hypothetical protein